MEGEQHSLLTGSEIGHTERGAALPGQFPFWRYLYAQSGMQAMVPLMSECLWAHCSRTQDGASSRRTCHSQQSSSDGKLFSDSLTRKAKSPIQVQRRFNASTEERNISVQSYGQSNILQIKNWLQFILSWWAFKV